MNNPLCSAARQVAAAALACLATAAVAADWPQYRGPNHNGTTPAKIATAWPAGGPKVAWKSPTPAGFSTFTVQDGRAYTVVAREVDGAKQEVCLALNASTGKELWAAPLNIAKYDGGGDSGAPENKGGDGPRTSPAVDSDHVFVLDARFKLHCLSAADGKPVWVKDLVQDFGGKNIQWQNAASAVVDGGLVFVAGGGEGQSLLAFNAKDGSVAWKGESEKATHATPTVATIHGVRQVVFFTQSGLVACDAKSGEVLWRQPYRFSVSTAASPVVEGDIVYCSAGYGVGAGAYRIAKNGDAWSSAELWRKTGNDLANHWSTPIAKDGHLYGMFSFKEYGTGALKCVELATGKEVWAEANFGPGGVVLAGNALVALNDRGEVVLVDPQPVGYKELARVKAVDGKCWNNPTVSSGRIYARSTQEGACLDVPPSVSGK